MNNSTPVIPEHSQPPGLSKGETSLPTDADAHEVGVELIDKPTRPTEALLDVELTVGDWSERVTLEDPGTKTVRVPVNGGFLRAAGRAQGIDESQRIRYAVTLNKIRN